MSYLQDILVRLPILMACIIPTITPIVRCSELGDVNTLISTLGLSGISADTVASAVRDLSEGTTDVRKAAAACAISRTVFGNRTGIMVDAYTDPTATDYLKRIDVNWSDSCWLNASCIISPSTVHDVASALSIATFTGSKFATRSGGHNPNPGFGSIDSSGVLIDMVNMNTLQISPDRRTISIGPGNRWENVYHGLNGSGVFATGGRVPPVGVGGLMLGGGMPFFSSLYGLAADAVQDYEIVLANSSLVHANARENSDLWWALKGGGPNFGIVTKYTVDAIPSGNVWFEQRLFNSSQTLDLLPAVVEYQAAAEKDPNANLVFTATSAGTIVGFIYAQAIVRPPVFSMFYDIPFESTTTNSTIGTPAELADSYANVVPIDSTRFVTCSTVLEPDVKTYQQSYSQFVGIAAQVAASFNGAMTWVIQPLQSRATEIGYQRGGNALGLSNVSQSWFTASVQWKSDANTQAAFAAVQATCGAVKRASITNGVSLPNLFQNDANYAQNVLASYGTASLARLKATSLKYDPHGVFQKLQNSGFLLSKA